MLSLSYLKTSIDSNGLPFFSFYSQGRLAKAISIFLGWVTGSFFYVSGWFYSEAFVVFSIVMILLLIVLLTFTSRPVGSLQMHDEQPLPKHAPRWINRCHTICDEYNLSPRESEVFVLLAKGRDGSYIAQELHISIHTAKSHIYRIYSKIDLHSQQDLISLLESSPEV